MADTFWIKPEEIFWFVVTFRRQLLRMSKFTCIDSIVSHGLCAGCGLCASLSGEKSVQMSISAGGQMRPQVKRQLSRATMNRIRAVCPGIRITGPDRKSVGSQGTMHPIWGPVRTINRGWSLDPEIRFQSAAGGTLTALGIYLLNTNAVDAILHVRASTDNPLLTDAQISRTAGEVRSGAASRYGPASPLLHVHRLLDEGVRFAVIAKPCDIAGIRNLQRIDDRADKQIPYCLTMFCGGVPTVTTAREIIAYHGVDESAVEEFRFRGNGWPGPLRVRTSTGKVFDHDYTETWSESRYPWKYDMQFRCKICPDAIGEQADVTCPDGWLMEDDKPVHKEAPGISIVIARTARGQRLVEDAAAADCIKLEPCDLSEMKDMHYDHLSRKFEYPARSLAMKLSGCPAPKVRNFRFWWTVLHAGLTTNVKAFWETRKRVIAGYNREAIDDSGPSN